MEEIKSNQTYSYTIHQSPFLLILRISIVETLVMMVHYSSRVILIQLADYLNWRIPISVLTLEIAVLQLINLYLILSIVLKWINVTYTFNPKEVIVKQGVFSTKTITYEFANLQSMTVTQNMIQKIFNYGTVKLFNPVLKEEVHLIDIPTPNKFANLIQQYQPEITPLIKKQK